MNKYHIKKMEHMENVVPQLTIKFYQYYSKGIELMNILI